MLLLPLSMWRNRGNIVGIDGAGSGVAESQTTDIFTDLIEGCWSSVCGSTETETVAQWNLDVCPLLAGSC
jgi:hypothetical protein